MAESELHIQLKHAACRWLWETGYAAIANEVAVPGVGIIDVVAAGKWRRHNPRRVSFDREPNVDRHHIVFVECKAMRADFLRDQGRQQQFSFALAERAERRRAGRSRKPRHASGALGKFDSCLMRPHAQQHYLLTPPKLLRLSEVPRRWGWLTFNGASIRVMRKPAWQEVVESSAIEGAIARALTAQRLGLSQRNRRSPEDDRTINPASGMQRLEIGAHGDSNKRGACVRSIPDLAGRVS